MPEPMIFLDPTEREAWVRFAAAALSRNSKPVEDAAEMADEMLVAFRARCADPRRPPVPGPW